VPPRLLQPKGASADGSLRCSADYDNGSPTGKPTNGISISNVKFTGKQTTVAASGSKAQAVKVLCGSGSCKGTWDWSGLKVRQMIDSPLGRDLTSFFLCIVTDVRRLRQVDQDPVLGPDHRRTAHLSNPFPLKSADPRCSRSPLPVQPLSCPIKPPRPALPERPNPLERAAPGASSPPFQPILSPERSPSPRSYLRCDAPDVPSPTRPVSFSSASKDDARREAQPRPSGPERRGAQRPARLRLTDLPADASLRPSTALPLGSSHSPFSPHVDLV
jgi:hypothetical protein